MFERVVVGVRDGDEAGRDAIALARELATAEAGLTLVHVEVVTAKPSSDSGAARDAAESEYVLRRLAELAGDLDVEGSVAFVEAGSVRDGLREFAARRHADLLVVSTTRRDAYERTWVGDDTRELLDGAPCPVAVAPAGYATRASGLASIGVAYDGAPESEEAVALARRLAAERGAELSAFEAVPEPIVIHGDIERQTDEEVAAARRRVSALGGLTAEAASGDPVEQLTCYARSVDLLVIGSQRYRPTDRLWGGSTAQRLADETPSPLLVLARTAPSDG